MKKWLLTLTVGLCAATVNAQESGFLDDYSQLKSTDGGFVARLYLTPEAVQKFADYDAVLVDQPEIIVAGDSKYKGAKGDQLKLLADTARMAVMDRVQAGGFRVVDEPGPNTLYVRWAITDLYLQKKKRGFFSYTPLGMVVHSTRQAAIRDLWKKIDIAELSLELEVSDMVSGEILGAAVTARQGLRKAKGQKADIVTWQELDALFSTLGERVRCNLTNAALPQRDWEICSDIWIEPEPEK